MTADSEALTFVDTHAHLDDEQYESDVDDVIDRALAMGVSRIVNIGYEPAKWRTTIALAIRFPSVTFTLGLHPSESQQFSTKLVEELGELAQRSGAVAIGEIGIDLFRDGPSLELQVKSFEAQIALARSLGLPVVVHQRAASDEVLGVLSKAPPSQKFILHSFEGSGELVSLGISRGYYFGIGGLMTRNRSELLRKLIKEIPLDLMLLETDSPYLAPAGAKGRRNEPANLPRIAAALAGLLDIPLSDVADTTSRNAIEIFRLDSVTPVRATMS
jgi:TatD DNase family protein